VTQESAQQVEGQQHPITLYLVVWGWLFVLSTCSYLVDYFGLQGYTRWSLILLFMVLKAGLIVAVFMHMAWERLALVYAILVPPGVVLLFVAIMAFESDYTHATRLAFFVPGEATTQLANLGTGIAETQAGEPRPNGAKSEAQPRRATERSGSPLSMDKVETLAPRAGDTARVANLQNGGASYDGTARTKVYTVRPGDTLWKIAETEYGRGHGNNYRLIIEANKPLLSGSTEIHPEQVLRIPPP